VAHTQPYNPSRLASFVILLTFCDFVKKAITPPGRSIYTLSIHGHTYNTLDSCVSSHYSLPFPQNILFRALQLTIESTKIIYTIKFKKREKICRTIHLQRGYFLHKVASRPRHWAHTEFRSTNTNIILAKAGTVLHLHVDVLKRKRS